MLPFGSFLRALVGSALSIDCATRSALHRLTWRFPNETEVIANAIDEEDEEVVMAEDES